jgi:hypothetical protein
MLAAKQNKINVGCQITTIQTTIMLGYASYEGLNSEEEK